MNHRALLDLDSALTNPIERLDYWLNFGADGGASFIRSAVAGLVGRERDIDVAVLRMLTTPHVQVGATKAMAERFGVTSAAISQRRAARLAAIHSLRALDEVGSHPLVVLWRKTVGRIVCLDDLPDWVMRFLGSELESASSHDRGDESTPLWGSNEDVVRLLLQVALDRPVLVREFDANRCWLVSRGANIERESEVDLRQVLEELASAISGEEYACLTYSDYNSMLRTLGVAPGSIDRVRSLLQCKPIRRTLESEGRVLVFSDSTSSRGSYVVRLAQSNFGLGETDAIELVAREQQRKQQSLRAELRASARS